MLPKIYSSQETARFGHFIRAPQSLMFFTYGCEGKSSPPSLHEVAYAAKAKLSKSGSCTIGLQCPLTKRGLRWIVLLGAGFTHRLAAIAPKEVHDG